ncbi:MAG: hydrogenase maturation protease [Candidatus Heimdallarchaeota archaeon]|nr:hydrogenase maturation protease [Candidatus Heimdallarchaeota archaeon]MCK5048413.1 hydrogenase maturation protease [Candidatus Heimdallarchaeota archaeon]
MKIIIGIGNQFRNDDAIGLKMIDLLEKQKLSHTLLHKINTDIFSVDEIILSEEGETKQVLFIDALLNEHLPVGSIVTMIYASSQDQQAEWKSASSTHEIGILEYLSLLTKMNSTLPKIYLMGIVVKDIEYGETISQEVTESKKKAHEMIEEWVKTDNFPVKIVKPE